MKTTGLIQPVAFTLRPEAGTTELEVWGLSLPRVWREWFMALEQERLHRKDVSFPIRALNDIITALCDRLMTVPGQTRPEEQGKPAAPWLLARSPFSTEPLAQIVRAWCVELFADCPSLQMIQQAIRADDLLWKPVQLSLASAIAPNYTAKPERLLYAALPAHLADLLVKQHATLPVYGLERALVRVPSVDGAELMSWPPVYHVDQQGQQWGYSYTISITVQTLTGDPSPRIHLHYGVRRWASRPLLEGDKLFLGTSARSAFVRFTERSGFDLSDDPLFTRASLRGIFQGDKRIPIWTNALPAIARRLRIRWPEAKDLAEDPIKYLSEQAGTGVVAAIVQPQTRNHPVKSGVGLDDHEMMTTILQQKLASELECVPPLIRQKTITKPSKHPLEKNLRDLPREQRLEAVADSIGPQVTVEIWWTTQEGRDMLVDRLHAMLCGDRPALVERPPTPPSSEENEVDEAEEGYPDDEMAADAEWLEDEEEESNVLLGLWNDGEEVTVSSEEDAILNDLSSSPSASTRKKKSVRAKEPVPTQVAGESEIPLPGGRLRIIPRQLDELGAVFPAPAYPLTSRAERAKYHREQTEVRVKQIIAKLPQATEPTLVIIEMPNYRKPKQRRLYGLRDPRRALRLGLAHTKRVTKFTVGNTDPALKGNLELLRHRCTGTVLDGLRQMGYLPEPIGFTLPTSHSFPKNLLVASIWMVRLTQKRGFLRVHFPMVVLFHTAHRQVRAWIPDGKGSRPFYQTLLDMTTMPPEKVQRNNQHQAVSQLRQFLLNLHNEGDDDVLIMAEAQNIRQTLTGFQNPEVVWDAWRATRDDDPVPVTRLRGRLRVARLRSNAQRETPEWFTPGASAGKGYAQGIWPLPGINRTFYNIAAKPSTMSQPRKGKQVNPGELYTIPSMLEIVLMALQEDDDPGIWAFAINQWRKMSYNSDAMTLLPMPLQWAEHVDRYAEVIGPWVFQEQWGQEEDEGDDDED